MRHTPAVPAALGPTEPIDPSSNDDALSVFIDYPSGGISSTSPWI